MDHKIFKFKDMEMPEGEKKGEFTAVFATLDVVDHDGDIIQKGAIGNQDVVISAYGHRSWLGGLPIGKGKTIEIGNEAIVKGRIFVETTGGNDAYITIKALDKLQEWSFSLLNVERGEKDKRKITSVKINEVSPVLKGAGINTRLLGIKKVNINDTKVGDLDSQKQKKESTQFFDQIMLTIETVDAVLLRATKIRILRDAEGGSISEKSKNQLKILYNSLHDLADRISLFFTDAKLDAKLDVKSDDVAFLIAHFEKITRRGNAD